MKNLLKLKKVYSIQNCQLKEPVVIEKLMSESKFDRKKNNQLKKVENNFHSLLLIKFQQARRLKLNFLDQKLLHIL